MHSPATRITSQTLYQAFAAAEYRVHVDGRWLLIRIGCRHPQLDQALDLADWAIVTAWNPGGQRCSDAANRRAEQALRQAVTTHGWTNFEALNRDPNGAWPDEPGRLIVAAPQNKIKALAQHFGQAAIVCAEAGAPARLLFLNETTGAPDR